MNDNFGSCGCGCNCNSCNNNNGLLGGLFCGENSEILFFLVVFLLLFTGFGCSR